MPTSSGEACVAVRPHTGDRFVRPVAAGKFLHANDNRFWIKGVSYGTFAPDACGRQFPPAAQVAADFAAMRRSGFNTVRTYTVPDLQLLDIALENGLRVMAGLPWTQHVAFLDDRRLWKTIRRDLRDHVRALCGHPAIMLFALGNEIPAPIVRWLGPERVEGALRQLYDEAKALAPDGLFTYVNYPPTEHLNLPFLDVVAFNVYLHQEDRLRAYLARLQNLAGCKPLLVAEAGADSIRHTPDGQAALAAMQVRAAMREGACGAIAFAWTDEWWRGGSAITDWAFGLVDAERHPKPALHAVADVFSSVPFPAPERRAWPKVSVVVCAYNAADTLDDCLTSIQRLSYPDFDVIVVNDGSTDATGEIARRYERVRVVEVPNGGLSAARNIALGMATGEIIAYTDADVRVDPDWLTYLVQPFMTSDVVGAGGPNVIPPDDGWIAQCVARAPGGPTHVLLDDRVAEHVPGCNMAFYREKLLAVGGFNPIFTRAGDDVDLCWRLQARGWTIGFAPAALVWHHHRTSVRAYWQQQAGYGEGETWLLQHHRHKFAGSTIAWRGHIYSPLPFVRALSKPRVNTGIWGTAAFPSVYQRDSYPFAFLPHRMRWQLGAAILVVAGFAAAMSSGHWSGYASVAAGVAGLLITAARCLRYAFTSDIDSLPILGRSHRLSRGLYRSVITWLHLIQPLARAYGRLRGLIAYPPTMRRDLHRAAAGSGRWLTDVVQAIALFVRPVRESQYWSERWLGAADVLTALAARLRGSAGAHRIELDDGWQSGRDIRIATGSLIRLDLRLLIEEHGRGRCLVRIGQRMTPSPWCVAAMLLAVSLAVTAAMSAPLWLTSLHGAGSAAAVIALGRAAWGTARIEAAIRRITTTLATELKLQRLSAVPAWRRLISQSPAASPPPVCAPAKEEGAPPASPLSIGDTAIRFGEPSLLDPSLTRALSRFRPSPLKAAHDTQEKRARAGGARDHGHAPRLSTRAFLGLEPWETDSATRLGGGEP